MSTSLCVARMVPSATGFIAPPRTPNDVVIAIEFTSEEQGKALLEDPSLREAMQRAGVQGEPHVHFREPVETIEY